MPSTPAHFPFHRIRSKEQGLGQQTVVLYQRVKHNKWTFQKVAGPRQRNLCDGTYYLSWYEGSKKQMENVGPDAAQALKALDKKIAELRFVAAGGQISAEAGPSSANSHRPTIQTRTGHYLADRMDRQGKSVYGLAPRTVEAYTYRLGFLTEFRPSAYFDEVDTPFVKEFRRFLRNHPEDLGDRTCHNIMQAVSTFLISFGSSVAKPVLKEMSFPPKPVLPYTREEMGAFFAACDEKEELIFKFIDA